MAVGSASLLDDEAQEDGPSRPGAPLDPGRVWLSIKRGWKLLPIGAALGAAVGVLGAMLLVKQTFKTEAVLIWEPEGGAAAPATSMRDLSTQAGILKARVVLEGARKQLKLGMPIDVLTKQVEVWFDAQSNLVTIETTSPSAKGAYDLADALITSFLEHQRALGRTRTRDLIETLKTDQKAAATSRDQAQAAYDAFRAKHGIGDFEFDSQRALTTLEDLRKEADEAQAEVGELDARTEQLDALKRTQPRMMAQSASRSDPAVERAAALKSEIAIAQARLSSDHPRLALLTAQLAAAEKQAASGSSVVSNVMSAADPTFEQTKSSLATTRVERAATAQKTEALQGAIAKAEERVNAFNAIGGEARKLLSNVSQTQQRAQDLTAQLSRAEEAEHSLASVPFRVLTPPALPEYPQSSKRKFVAIALTLLSLLGCGLFLVLRPARDGLVYTAREAAFWGKVPVVGTSAWPRRPQAFRSLVDELNDRAMLCAGSTLVVASSQEDKALAGALAAFLGPHPRPMSYSELGDAAVPAPQTTALATRQANDSSFFAWPGDSDGPTLRRAARMSDRVLVVVRAGGERMLHAATLGTRLGREANVAMVVVGVPDELLKLPDRVGKVDAFWQLSPQRAG